MGFEVWEGDRSEATMSAPRYKVRFPDAESMYAGEATESPTVAVPVRNERRSFVSVVALPFLGVLPTDAEAELERQLDRYTSEYGAEVVEDVRYDLEQDGSEQGWNLPVGPEDPQSPSLDDVLELVGARRAWETSRGAGTVLAIVDTGVNGSRPEFPPAKRIDQWAPAGANAWEDTQGHGTMCACIATGTRSTGGAFDGIAPDAGLISCRTSFFDSEVVTIYDFLADFATRHRELAVIASNSFGRKTGTPPPPPPDTDLRDAIRDAVAAGVTVCFSAGNYHELTGGSPDACSPTSIWLHKCLEDVLTVATCRLDREMWSYSSRGPGQYDGELLMSAKPDVTAPTPANGRVVYGDGIRSLPNGWGTSGACPQVAGLAALLLGKRRAAPADVYDAIRSSAVALGHGATCEGHGMIDCAAAVQGF